MTTNAWETKDGQRAIAVLEDAGLLGQLCGSCIPKYRDAARVYRERYFCVEGECPNPLLECYVLDGVAVYSFEDGDREYKDVDAAWVAAVLAVKKGAQT